GAAEIVTDDAGSGARGRRQLLRDVFTAAGGTHDDWDEYDRVMVEDGRVPIFITPDRILGVP
ncbi:MAG: pyridoxamine 5'-phosphate oxidase, partial [Actinobacteria bacterium]|nr:pyridoxamine 5'-phosphate oxidase [Actinomycetota bacterium]